MPRVAAEAEDEAAMDAAVGSGATVVSARRRVVAAAVAVAVVVRRIGAVRRDVSEVIVGID